MIGHSVSASIIYCNALRTSYPYSFCCWMAYISFFSTNMLFSVEVRSFGHIVMKLTAVHRSIPHVTFSSTSIPNFKDLFMVIYLFLHFYGSQPHSGPHSYLTFMQSQVYYAAILGEFSSLLAPTTIYSSSLMLQHDPLHLDTLSVFIISLIYVY